ncbi:hypothetical protein LARI1_G005240 [Lachnellula arida]|uniref:Uncharacterized protein n=1 Tax=Lachnellula arida TaxID=1316785 RepID=A0A8T9BD32_9HELO|nr:hypothetical protein LARI1_G005240 [Lachnellula arida]
MHHLMLKQVSNCFRSASGKFCKHFAPSDDRDTPATEEPISFPLYRRSPGIRLDDLSSGDVLITSPMWIHRIHRPHTDYG